MKHLIWLATIVVCLSGCDFATPSSGDKVGQIAKVQVAGVICKTNEVLVTGKFGGGELKLTVPDHLLPQVKAANESQAFVKVNYHVNMVNSICNNETHNAWLDSVELHPAGAP